MSLGVKTPRAEPPWYFLVIGNNPHSRGHTQPARRLSIWGLAGHCVKLLAGYAWKRGEEQGWARPRCPRRVYSQERWYSSYLSMIPLKIKVKFKWVQARCSLTVLWLCGLGRASPKCLCEDYSWLWTWLQLESTKTQASGYICEGFFYIKSSEVGRATFNPGHTCWWQPM